MTLRKRLVWRFLRSRFGGVIHGLVVRDGQHGRCPFCGWVWREIESIPGFNEELRKAEAELAAGGGIRYRVVDGRLERMP